jgi:2-oxoglutarate dehydrogenase E1 component
MFQDAFSSSYLSGGNAAFVEDLYEQYLQDPGSVDAAWRQHFDGLAQAAGGRDVAHGPVVAAFQALARSRPAAPRQAQEDLPTIERKQVSVLQLINAYRFLGVRHANVDPLGRAEKPYLPELDPAHYGFTAEDMGTTFNTGSLVGPDQLPLRDIIKAVQETYCGSIGAEYMHITDTPQKRWIQARLESVHGRPQFAPEFRRWLLERVTAAEGLERYLHTRFVGQKRFSGEGGEALTPVLDHLLQQAGAKGVQESVIGMAHRGRLNVLVNTLGKMPQDLFAEFEGKHNSALLSGDVK